MSLEKKATRDELWNEAIDRMELMGIPWQDRNDAIISQKVNFKVVVNDEERSIRKMPVTEKEQKMINEIEDEYAVICYYLTKDKGIFPDGTEFNRYTLFFVSDNKKEYDMIEEGIREYSVAPVFVENVEFPEYSECTECEFQNMSGLIINVS